IDVAVAHVLANHRAILGFHQSVIVAVPGTALGLLDQQLVQQTGHGLVDELGSGHDLPLRDLIDGVDVVDAFGARLIAPGARCRPADSQAGLADWAAAARRCSPAWAWSCHTSDGVRDSAAGGADCTGGPPRCSPAAHTPACRTAGIRAAECAVWPLR